MSSYLQWLIQSISESESHSVMSDYLQPHGPYSLWEKILICDHCATTLLHENKTLWYKVLLSMHFEHGVQAIFLASYKKCMLNCVWLFVTPRTIAHSPGSFVHGISQERIPEWVLFHIPGDLPDPGNEPKSLVSPSLARRFFTNCTTWEASHKRTRKNPEKHWYHNSLNTGSLLWLTLYMKFSLCLPRIRWIQCLLMTRPRKRKDQFVSSLCDCLISVSHKINICWWIFTDEGK